MSPGASPSPYPFHPTDFTPSVHTAFLLWNSTPTYTTALGYLAKSLRTLHTALSELEAQAESPSSLLQTRCSDRRNEWISIRTSLSKTTDDISALLIEGEEYVESHVNVLVGKLRVVIARIEGFVESLGLSEREEVPAKIERILLNQVFEERTGVRRERVLGTVERNDQQGWEEVRRVLEKGGVPGEEVRKYGAKVKSILYWVVKNEPALTVLRENAGLSVY